MMLMSQLMSECVIFVLHELVQGWFGAVGALALSCVGTGLRTHSTTCVIVGLMLLVALLVARQA